MAAGAGQIIGGFINTAAAGQAQQEQQQLTAQQQQILQAALAKINGIAAPDGSFNLTAPEQYALSQYATPEAAQARQVNIDPQDRANQMAALQKLQGYSNGAADSELNAANYNAMNNAATQRHSADAATMQNLASRGVAGSGLELAQKQQSAQNAAQNAQSGGLEAARNNALAKLQGNNAYLSGMSNVRGQDTSQAAANANIINQFNMANTNARNAVNQANVGMKNQQSTMNTQQNNDYQKYLAQMNLAAQQQSFQDKLGQAGMAAGQSNNIAQSGYNSGMTGVALGQNTIGAAANGLGGAAQGIYQSVSADPKIEQTPQAMDVSDGSSFTGTPPKSGSDDPNDPNYGWG